MLPPYVTDEKIDAIIEAGLAEDVGSGDVTTLAAIDATTPAKGRFHAKESGILAGTYVAERVFHRVDPEIRIDWHAGDGDAVEQGSEIGTLRGRARPILTAERLALNLLQRMSGIASATNAMSRAIQPHSARLLDTRKTAPGLRVIDKWAVLLGGGRNHRTGLFDMFLIKDNHIAAAGSITRAVRRALIYREQHAPGAQIEVEASTLDDVEEILECPGVDVVLLDNMVDVHPDGRIEVGRLAKAVALVSGRLKTEASGNVTLESISAIAATGVDFISAGSLTHSSRALDISLKLELGAGG